MSTSSFAEIRPENVYEIGSNVAAVTVSVVESLTDPEAAVMSDEPGVFDVARPELFTVATPVVPEVQITAFVRSTVEPSL